MNSVIDPHNSLKFWHRFVAGVITVIVAGAVYFGMGAAISKQSHVAVVLIFRYYFRALLVGLVCLWLMPVLWSRCMPESETSSQTSSVEIPSRE